MYIQLSNLVYLSGHPNTPCSFSILVWSAWTVIYQFDYYSFALSTFARVQNGTFVRRITHLPGYFLTHLPETCHICRSQKMAHLPGKQNY